MLGDVVLGAAMQLPLLIVALVPPPLREPSRHARAGQPGRQPGPGSRLPQPVGASFHDEAAQRLVAHTNDDPPSPRDAGPPDRLFTPPSTDERPLMNHSASKGRSRRKR
ncbi:hypothetical protein EMIHUDRAFT_353155 [Emiliania huxleyi CCMP1516]|uniref:Secreted protein n=2 Tax=Emiliania huxleyi TaxID=2903 RepID=A0A0D3K085_EMIH1|nr:hypothetical protein EMIHUDRAFT_353155 [Emiliania huxleyi CCMP1516]EOD29170.1 hypothetical protein EMIHUDRAFT_353155 [Emiliania huxleyi CCMP1516]|eukprot:XP_005781599.1 hypothetical protein EMIHUDRAFT_353155 [Emiliania huxleyi CCMP1516]